MLWKTYFFVGKFGISKEFGISNARLAKLLRLSKVKDLLKEQVEKHGIRVHITPSQYTSQTCPKCGNISRGNRMTQKHFKCIRCGYEGNADYVAAQNIELRYTSDVLRSKLHDTDKYGRLVPRDLSTPAIRAILNEYYRPQRIETLSYEEYAD